MTVFNRNVTVGVREAAQLLGTRLESIYLLVWAGKLPAEKDPSGIWKIPTEAVEARKRLRRDRARARWEI